MSTREFLNSATIILVAMAVIAVAELIQPLYAPPAKRGRRSANLGMTVLTLGLNWALTSAAALVALAIPLRGPGLMARLDIPRAAQVVVSVAALDLFFGYLAHRAMHMTPILWRVHRVHHADAFVDATTTYRTHPIEVAWRFLFMMMPIAVLGIPAQVVVTYRLISALNGILEHANIRVWRHVDRALAWIWVTPNMHKVHHSRERVETDSNYGNILSIYDRTLRTFTSTDRAFAVVYGLDDVDPARASTVGRLLTMPFVRVEPRASSPGIAPGNWRKATLAGLAVLAVLARTVSAAPLNTAQIEQLTGAKGALDASEGVFKVSLPRSDLTVTVAGVKIVPALGLTSWAAFQPAGDHTMVMGDVVLQEDQVVPVMDAALDNGLEVTALHNHFLGDSPKVMFMHIGGSGDQQALAAAVGKVFTAIQQTSGGKGRLPSASFDAAASTLDAAVIDTILGTKGAVSGGIYKAVFGRKAKMHGQEIGAAIGVNTWAAFAGSEQQAVVDGDFAMSESELQPILKALRKADIAVVAIHNHMTMEEPRIVFLHFWGIGPLRTLATGIRNALDTQARIA